MSKIVVLAPEGVDNASLRGPWEVWSTANDLANRRRPSRRPAFDIRELPFGSRDTVSASALASVQQLDVVWVAGSQLRVIPNEQEVEELTRLRDVTDLMVGTGSGCLALAAAGLVSGLVAVDSDIEEQLGQLNRDVEVDADATYVDQGHLLTSPADRSVDAALRVVARQSGARLADQVASHLGLQWVPGDGRVLPPPSGDGLF